jgi:phage/plasmid-associated DNA primase
MIRIYLAIALLLALAGGGWYLHHQWYDAGYQAKSAEVAKQDAKAKVAADMRESAMRDAYNALANRYEQDKADAQATHDRDVAALHAGTLKLQDRWTCPGVPYAAARSRELDAEATAALAHRAAVEAGAVRIATIGYDADKREADLRAQVTALQGVVRADREPHPPH